MFTNKRGISPLIATVLLVGFTIVLAVIVINFVLNATEDQTASQGCQAEAQSVCLEFAGAETFQVVHSATGDVVTVTNLAPSATNFSVSVINAAGQTTGSRELGPIGFGTSMSTPPTPLTGSLAIATGDKVRVLPTVDVTVDGQLCPTVACTAAIKEITAA